METDGEAVAPSESTHNNGTYALLDKTVAEMPRRRSACSVLRISLVLLAAIVCLVVLGGDEAAEWLLNMDVEHRSSVNIRGVQDKFNFHPQNEPYEAGDHFRADATCPNTGAVCICSEGYRVIGPDPNFPSLHAYVPDAKSVACQPWKFQVGDVVMTDKPRQKKYWQAELVSRYTHSDVVHVAIVSDIPAEGEEQHGGNVFVVEALKGQVKKVQKSSLDYLVVRYPFGGLHIRRVDGHRFPFFPHNHDAIKKWLNARIDDPFDVKMVNPVKRRFTDGKRMIGPDPWCPGKDAAYAMYTEGGPGKWICSQLVAWTLAFAGGLNTQTNNPEYKDPNCDQPKWVVTNLEPNPGDFAEPTKSPYMEISPEVPAYYVPCSEKGCFLALSLEAHPVPDIPAKGTLPPLYTGAPPGVQFYEPVPPSTTPHAPGEAQAIVRDAYIANKRKDVGIGLTLSACAKAVKASEDVCAEGIFDFVQTTGRCHCATEKFTGYATSPVSAIYKAL